MNECECCKKLIPILSQHLHDYSEMLRTMTELIANIRTFMEGNPRAKHSIPCKCKQYPIPHHHTPDGIAGAKA